MNNVVGVVLGSPTSEVAFEDQDNDELDANVVSYDTITEEDSKIEEDITKSEEDDSSTIQDDDNWEEKATVVDVVDP